MPGTWHGKESMLKARCAASLSLASPRTALSQMWPEQPAQDPGLLCAGALLQPNSSLVQPPALKRCREDLLPGSITSASFSAVQAGPM